MRGRAAADRDTHHSMTLHPTHRRHPDHPTQIFNIFFSVGFERGSDPEERTLVVLCTCLSHTPETTHTRRIHTLHGAAPPHRRTALKPQQPRDHHATHQNRKEPSGGPLSQSPPALSVSPVVSVSTSLRYTVRTRKEARTHRHVPLSPLFTRGRGRSTVDERRDVRSLVKPSYTRPPGD